MNRMVLFLFFTMVAFSQSSQSLEDKIYHAIDVFVAQPNTDNLQKLEIFAKTLIPKTKQEKLATVVLYCNKAYYENQLGQTQKAVLSYEKAWKIYAKQNQKRYDIIEYCLKPLGNLYTILGDYDNAENTIKEYYFLATKSKNTTHLMAAMVNLSNVYQGNGKPNLAIALLEKTIESKKLNQIQRGILLNNLGANYLVSNNLIKAEKAFRASIRALEKNDNQYQSICNAYRNLSNLYAQKNNLEQATHYFEKASLLFWKSKNRTPREQAKFYLDYAVLLAKKQKITASSTVVLKIFSVLLPNYNSQKEILPNAHSLYAETLLLDALDLQASLFLQQNQAKKALDAFALATKIEDLFATQILYENTQIIAQIREHNRTEKCLAIYQSLFEKEKKRSYIEQAFQLSEKSKFGVLKKKRLLSKTASDLEKVCCHKLQNLTNQIVKEQQKGNLASIEKINQCIQKQNRLMLLLKENTQKNTNLKAPKCNLNLIFDKLKQDNAQMVCYFSGTENNYCFGLKNRKITMKVLANTADFESKTRAFIRFFNAPENISNAVFSYQETAKWVYDALALPMPSDSRNLIIVPDGILCFLPFEALITKPVATVNFAKMRFFKDYFQIGYAHSAEFYLDNQPLHKEKSVLGIFPVFDKTDYALAFSKSELQHIKNQFDGLFLENNDATFAAFKKNAKNYTLLHFSTHASAGDSESPASIKFYDQEILYSELYDLDIHPDLVVLSACETGIGKWYRSEGAMSVARGFENAGAKNVLLSLWKVNDYTTSVLMADFYESIKKGTSFFEAHAQAQNHFLQNKVIPNAKKSPYYWGAFVYYGTLENKERSRHGMCFLLVISAVVLVLICLRLKQKRVKRG